MLSDEEREALERIDYIQDFIIENGQYNADVNDMKYFSKVLNLIEKQSKEITKLTNDFVSKDKIKAKIEELENKLEYGWESEYEYCKEVLQSLLEKE